MTRPAQVYRAFDKAGRLLYVGCSIDVDIRLGQHAQSSPWWIYTDRIERQDFASREEAEAAETEAIATEHPRWNIHGRSREHPDGWATGVASAHWLAGEMEVWRSLRQLRDARSKTFRQLRQIDLDLAAVCSLVDQISSSELVYEQDYDREGPLTLRERKLRALDAVRDGGAA